MKKFSVGGMSCAACSARVEKAVSALPGVEKCSVNLLTGSMNVEGTADSEMITVAVVKAGYSASEIGAEKNVAFKKSASGIKEMLVRLMFSVVFLIVLMYVSMGYVMFGAPLMFGLKLNPVTTGIIELILSMVILVVNQKFFVNGFKGALCGSPNMDTLVAIGSGASFIYSICVLFMISNECFAGKVAHANHMLHDLYFESAAMILTLVTVGKTLEAFSKGKTASALNSLINLKPKKANVLIDGKETEINADEIKIDNVFVVRPGESFPADAVILEGCASVDESALTGESIPVDKNPGDKVSAGTINKSGFLKLRATGVGENTVLAQIIKTVAEASSGKAPIARIADKVSGIFVPCVLGVAAATFLVWLLLGQSVGYALLRGISVLVISCPCALGLATPVAVMVGSGKAASNGILFRTAESLEQAGKTDVVVVDKTGTVTRGEPVVTDVINVGCENETVLLSLAYSLESQSEHPLAKAVCKKAESLGIELNPVSDFRLLAGSGVEGNLGEEKVCAVSFKNASERFEITQDVKKWYEKLASEGKTPLVFARNERVCGVIAVADEIKPDSREAVEMLKKGGIEVIMLTGDNAKTANVIARKAGIEKVVAGVLPHEKEKYIRSLKKNHKVAFVGDGINDAPALVGADVGIAIGAGSDIAVDSSEIVLMKSTVRDAAGAIFLSRLTLRNIKQNLFWAFIYNAIGIPVAAGALAFAGITLTPMLGAAAMSLSSVCVVANALRLNFADIYIPIKKKFKKEKKSMEKVIRIEGMMCPHCEARVKKVLEELEEVESAAVSHQDGTATVFLKSDVADDKLKMVIEDQGYKVVGFKPM